MMRVILLLLQALFWRVVSVQGGFYDVDPHKDTYQFIFPSAIATGRRSPFDMVSLFAPATLATPYPEFEAPHYVQDTFPNSCPYGIDQVRLDLPAVADNVLEGTFIGLALLINDVYVAETAVTKTAPDIVTQDVIFPPLTDAQFTVQLLVVSFDGAVDAGTIPGGMEILPHENGMPSLFVHCAPTPAVVVQGDLYQNTANHAQKRILPPGFEHCQVNPHRTKFMYLADSDRPGPLYPKPKYHYDCAANHFNTTSTTNNKLKQVVLPIPNEPFEPLPEDLQPYFDVHNSIFYVHAMPRDTIMPRLYETLCHVDHKDDTRHRRRHRTTTGGRNHKVTLRVLHLQCAAVPPGWMAHDVTADFVVHCPEIRTSDKGNKGSSSSSHHKEL